MFLLGGLEEQGSPIFSTRVLLYIDEIDSTKNCRKNRLAVYTRCQKWKSFRVLRSFPNFCCSRSLNVLLASPPYRHPFLSNCDHMINKATRQSPSPLPSPLPLPPSQPKSPC